MGIIFDRVLNISKAYINDFETNSMNYQGVHLAQDDLDRQINEALAEHIKKNKVSSDENIDSLDKAYRLLDVNASATNQEIKDATKEMLNKYSIEKVRDLGDELQEIAIKKTAQIIQAYQIIKKSKGF